MIFFCCTLYIFIYTDTEESFYSLQYGYDKLDKHEGQLYSRQHMMNIYKHIKAKRKKKNCFIIYHI